MACSSAELDHHGNTVGCINVLRNTTPFWLLHLGKIMIASNKIINHSKTRNDGAIEYPALHVRLHVPVDHAAERFNSWYHRPCTV